MQNTEKPESELHGREFKHLLMRRKHLVEGSLEGVSSFVARIPIEMRGLEFFRLFLPPGSCQSPFVFAAGIIQEYATS